MRVRDYAIRCADYVLSQDCEREAEFDSLKDYLQVILDQDGKLPLKKDMRNHVENSTWYSALVIRDGRKEANKEVTQLINEVLSE